MWSWLLTTLEATLLLGALVSAFVVLAVALGPIPAIAIVAGAALAEYGGYLLFIVIPYYRSHLATGEVVLPRWQTHLLRWYYENFVEKWNEIFETGPNLSIEDEFEFEGRYRNLCYLGTTVWNILHWWLFEATIGRVVYWLLTGLWILGQYVVKRWHWTRWILLGLWLLSIALWPLMWLKILGWVVIGLLMLGWGWGMVAVIVYFFSQLDDCHIDEEEIPRGIMWIATGVWGTSCLILDLIAARTSSDPELLSSLVYASGIFNPAALLVVGVLAPLVGNAVMAHEFRRPERPLKAKDIKPVAVPKITLAEVMAAHARDRRLGICPVTRKVVLSG